MSKPGKEVKVPNPRIYLVTNAWGGLVLSLSWSVWTNPPSGMYMAVPLHEIQCLLCSLVSFFSPGLQSPSSPQDRREFFSDHFPSSGELRKCLLEKSAVWTNPPSVQACSLPLAPRIGENFHPTHPSRRLCSPQPEKDTLVIFSLRKEEELCC